MEIMYTSCIQENSRSKNKSTASSSIMISLKVKTAEALNRTIRWARGEEIEFPSVEILRANNRCESCGEEVKETMWEENRVLYYSCECE